MKAARLRATQSDTGPREHILRGAMEILRAPPGGIGTLNLGAIADHLRLPEPSVRALFPDEPTLWGAVVDLIHRRLMGVLEHQAMQHHSPLVALEHVFRGHIAFLARHPAIPHLILQRARTGDGRLRERVRSVLERHEANLAVLLSQARNQGSLDPQTDPKTAASLLVTLILGLVQRAPLSGDGGEGDWLRREADRIWPLYLNGILSRQHKE